MATTYLISCPPGTDSSSCGYGSGATVVEGPSTLQMVIAEESIGCNLAGTTQAVCTQSQTLRGYSTTQLVTSTLGPADITYFPVGVTAGAEKLGPASASATSTGRSGEAGSVSTTATGVLGSISVAASSTSASGTGATSSIGESVSSSSTTKSVAATKGSSSMSQTQSASAATTSASSFASRTSEGKSSLAGVMGCLLGGVLAVNLL